MQNKFGANLILDFDEYTKLSKKYNIPVSEIIQIDFNRCGVYLTNNEVREGFRVRFKGSFLNMYESWYAVPVMSKSDTSFYINNNTVFFYDKNDVVSYEIGKVVPDSLVLDTCESSYQRGPNLLNLNSRSRSNCAGCTACIHNYHSFYDSTVLHDKKQIQTKQDFIDFLNEKQLDPKNLKQIAVVTGLFGSEQNVIEHLQMIDSVAVDKGFTGELMYFGCEVNSNEGLTELSKLSKPKLIYAVDSFDRRSAILSPKKAQITLDMAKDTLNRAKDKGIQTSIAYISGIDNLETMKNGMALFKDSITSFPIVNIFQIQTPEQSSILHPTAANLEYYIKSRIGIETIFADINLKPKRWENYRPLWYTFYNNEKLPNNSYGQLE